MTATCSQWRVDDPLDVLSDYDSDSCKIDGGHPCKECMNLEEVDADIRKAYDLLESLARKRKEVKEKVNQAHDPVLRHLPHEIVSLIFEHWVEDSQTNAFPDDVGLSHAVYSQPIKIVFEKPAPLVISAICRTWRRISFSQPRLWTSLNIFMNDPDKLSTQHQLVNEWLGRAGRLPLDVWIHCRPDVFEEEWDVAVLDTIKTTSPRWKNLRLSLPPRFCSRLLSEPLSVPLLKTVKILGNNSPYAGTIHPFEIQLPASPNLEDFQLYYALPLSNISIPWDQLSTFEMAPMSLNDLFLVLRRIPRLQKCTVFIFQRESDEYPRMAGPVLCRSVLHFELWLNSRPLRLFEYLSFPSLQCLILHKISEQVALDDLIPFCIRSGCQIKELQLEGNGDCLKDESLISFLEYLPSLEKLSLLIPLSYSLNNSTWITDRLFERFQVRAAFLPHLRDLKISAYPAISFSWPCVLDTLDVLHARMGRPTIPVETSQIHRVHINVNHLDTHGPVRLDAASLRRIAKAEWCNCISLAVLDGGIPVDLEQVPNESSDTDE